MLVRSLPAGVAVLFFSLLLSTPAAGGEPVPRNKVGELAPWQLSSSHPYASGTVETFEIEHPGATYIKVHFSEFALAPGDRLEVASPDGSERYFFSGRGFKQMGGDFWVNSVLGEKVILRLHSPSGGGYGFDVDYYAYGVEPLFDQEPGQAESVCGTNEWQDAACYETSFPSEFDRAKRAVVVLYNGVENCTGVKVGCPNQFLTNEHCVSSQAEVNVTEVRFEYQTATCGGSTSSFSESYLGDQFITDNFTLDYCLFTAEGVSDNYLAAEIDPRLPPQGERLYITGHPAGLPKKLSVEDTGSPSGLCQADVSPINGRGTDTDVGYYCDTTGGSSGSPVWSGESHKLIALHHFGGCPNSGVRMDLIHPEIESLLASCCETAPNAPTLSAATNGDNRIDLTWDDSDLATVVEYHVLRSRTPGGPYDTLAVIDDSSPGVSNGAGYTYVDTDVSGGVTYHYLVQPTDGATCRADSGEASATATGVCTLEPVFGGLAALNAPAIEECTLDLFWAPAIDECGGPLSYNVYRSVVPGFSPGPTNLIAGGVTTTAISDTNQLVFGTIYYYVVRAVDSANGVEDGNTVELSGTPRDPAGGACTTVSACPDNPFVDVQPNLGTVCENSGFTLSAVTTAGTGPFVYQWTRDGVAIPGSTDSTYVPQALGAHDYNVEVRAQACSDTIFDGLDSSITLVNTPFFGGVGSATNSHGATCALEVAWDPGSTVCDGPLRYFVYRDTVSPVALVPSNLVAAGLSGTSYTDSAELTSGSTYHYLVRAQDVSTGLSDSNTVDVSAVPDGPGSGPQALLDEDFEDPTSFADWLVTTGPGLHTCGEWSLDSAAAKRPSGASGSYAVADNTCNPLFARTSTTLTSPSIDVTLANLIEVTLEYDIWYNHDGGETGKVEVFDGSSWISVWQDANSDLNGHHSIDVTGHAEGNPSFQVRFDYQDATQNQWFSVDNAQVIAQVDIECATAPPGPPLVPDGTAGTNPLRGDRSTASGDAIAVSWDAGSCPATEYNLLYGDLAGVADVTITGSECSLGAQGSYAWGAVPAVDLFFLVVATDGAGTEGGWGIDGLGGERNELSPSGACATSWKEPTNTCP